MLHGPSASRAEILLGSFEGLAVYTAGASNFVKGPADTEDGLLQCYFHDLPWRTGHTSIDEGFCTKSMCQKLSAQQRTSLLKDTAIRTLTQTLLRLDGTLAGSSFVAAFTCLIPPTAYHAAKAARERGAHVCSMEGGTYAQTRSELDSLMCAKLVQTNANNLVFSI